MEVDKVKDAGANVPAAGQDDPISTYENQEADEDIGMEDEGEVEDIEDAVTTGVSIFL